MTRVLSGLGLVVALVLVAAMLIGSAVAQVLGGLRL